ncbi:MAG: endonuclease III [Bacteroidota bacterium]|nr:endonuclease III [Bacteroidota bacterium]
MKKLLKGISKESFEQKKARTKEIEKLLQKEYRSTNTALQYSSHFHLVVAVILSAQCTDVRVNLVTPGLFAQFLTIEDFATADVRLLEKLIHSTGFYHNKARNIIACAKTVLEKHQGRVPHTMEELIQLPGVGRKTANVVLGEAFQKIEGVVVDTHVLRLSQRLGLTKNEDAVKVEQDLMSLVPKKKWFHFSNALILHGKKICPARKPLCDRCLLSLLCPSSNI